MINPLIPMGAITRGMDKNAIEKMMCSYADAGIEQYLFYARGGCTIEYMSDEWLELCENIVREAEKLGIAVWLYDEYDCPSGTCARTVTRDFPEYRCQGIRNGEIVRDWAYTAMADLLNLDCVREFMDRTYEKLYARLKPWFGTTIKGIFSDEPSMGCMLRRTVDTHPYTPGIETEYAAEYGDDLFEGLKRHDARTLENYYALLGRRLKRTYMDTIREWCESRGVLFTGHLLEESNMRNAVNTSGNLLETVKGFSLPGIDEIFNYIGIDETEWLTLGTACAARNSNGALAELGAFGPCDNPPGRELQMLRLAALFGVDHYVIAVAGADCAGSAVKTDWLHPTNYTQPYFECFREYGRLAGQAAQLAGKTIAAEIAVEYPARAAAGEMEKASDRVDELLLPLLRALTGAQYQWVLIQETEKTPEGAERVRFDTPFEMIAARRAPAVRVCDFDGDPAEEVLVRRYTDGTVCVLDLRDTSRARRLKLIENGRETAFTLDGRGLYVQTETRAEYTPVRELDPPRDPILDRPLVKRGVFSEKNLEYGFQLDKEETVTLYIRQYKTDAEVCLDGRKIQAPLPCMGLTPGLRELYGQTEPMLLNAGTHRVSLSVFPGRSEYFLPSVFIEGISKDLNDFAGKLTYRFETELPGYSRDLCLQLEAHELPLRLSVNGECVGTRIAAPFVFDLPRALNGTRITVTVEQFTSVGPLFGTGEEVLKEIGGNGVLKRYFPGRYRGAGIESVRLLVKTEM